MTRDEFKKFVESTLEELIRFAEDKIKARLPHKMTFQWMFHEDERITEGIAEAITDRVYIDESHIYPCVDIGPVDLCEDGTLLIQAIVSGHQPREFGINWTGREGPFVFALGQRLADRFRSEQTT